jgi:hypothetical protein
MTLATLSRSTVEPLRRSPARARLDDAMAELRRAVAAMDTEDRERAAKRDRARQENAAKTERLVRLVQARLATKNLRIEIDRKLFWSLTGELIETLRQCAADAKRRGETGDVRVIERVIDDACTQLEKIQAKEAATK